MIFYVGLHQPSDAKFFDRCCLSVNRLARRRSIGASDWMMDSGAFTEIATHGCYRASVEGYASEVQRWSSAGNLEIAVAQDWMCEPSILQRTGLDVAEHQRLTIQRYDELVALAPAVPIMPVLQGYRPQDYVAHLAAYGDRLRSGMRVGVGSVCKRNTDPGAILAVLYPIHRLRPDLRLHGFGVKLTSLKHQGVRELLHSADSMAWSFHARKQGRNGNDRSEARAFVDRIEAGVVNQAWQMPLHLEAYDAAG
jgi:hypothetical protein